MTYDPSQHQPYDPYGNPQPTSGGYYAGDANQYPQQPGYQQQPGYPPQPGYSPQQYAVPPYAGQLPYGMPPQQQPQNGLGITGMVLGIIAAVFSICCAWFAAIPIGVPAIVFSAIGLSKANKGEANNKGMAMAGLICGIVSIVIAIGWFVLWMAGVLSQPSYRTYQ